MLGTIFERISDLATGLFINIPITNGLSKIYVLLNFLANILFAGNSPEGGFDLFGAFGGGNN